MFENMQHPLVFAREVYHPPSPSIVFQNIKRLYGQNNVIPHSLSTTRELLGHISVPLSSLGYFSCPCNSDWSGAPLTRASQGSCRLFGTEACRCCLMGDQISHLSEIHPHSQREGSYRSQCHPCDTCHLWPLTNLAFTHGPLVVKKHMTREACSNENRFTKQLVIGVL